MKQFMCGDVVPGCRRTFVGSEEQILPGLPLDPAVELVESVLADLLEAGENPRQQEDS